MILAVLILSWNFVFTDNKKIELTDSARVLQGLSLAIKYKIAIKEYWQARGKLPETEDWKGIGQSIKVDISKSLVKAIDVGVNGAGVITVYFANKPNTRVEKNIDGQKILLIPEAKGERLVWSCKGSLDKEYLPKKCLYADVEK